MTDDLLKRLRDHGNHIRGRLIEGLSDLCIDDMKAAADRIEQLETALRTMVKARENKPENCSDEYLVWCCIDTARAALAGEKKDGQAV